MSTCVYTLQYPLIYKYQKFIQVFPMTAPSPDAFFHEGAPLFVEIRNSGRTTVFTTKARPLSENTFRMNTTGDYEGASMASYQFNAPPDNLSEAYTSFGKKLSGVVCKLIEKDTGKLVHPRSD